MKIVSGPGKAVEVEIKGESEEKVEGYLRASYQTTRALREPGKANLRPNGAFHLLLQFQRSLPAMNGRKRAYDRRKNTLITSTRFSIKPSTVANSALIGQL